ncbi:PmoA family protein [Fuerstiella marisgermanici]|uniref:Methane oxygenase PmoA n=1 Tax=Fuerstiella marisgermanici TaxID=1891926 RepID=A0A1P8WFQ9_9PLAN|nr:PmoA family protein [Fuerstiella marisgermanici]APZ92891.1 hypothetical protein Fuma_02503 [Fuerstiella marisgermanici]
MNRKLSALLLSTLVVATATAQQPRLSFKHTDGQFAISVDNSPIATYVYNDDVILRPYFTHVKAPGGMQVTRNHPPKTGDRDDHASMHPGIWLAFGDISGNDFWRNKAKVKHVRFLQAPTVKGDQGTFVQQKRYLMPDGTVVCDEEFQTTIRVDNDGYLFLLQSTFHSEKDFYFGDQEEMGLGVRVATPISEVEGGQLTDATGRTNAKAIWSHSAAWCDYSGEVDGHRVGITIMTHPQNFRESWFHARDYGLLAANPFGRAAMKKGEPSKVIVRPGETLKLRYAVWIHKDADAAAITKVFNEYTRPEP